MFRQLATIRRVRKRNAWEGENSTSLRYSATSVAAMQTLNPKPYIVCPGDTLSGIARQHGFAEWETVYGAGCNEQLRLRRPNPDQIRPGDRIFIPSKPEDVRQVLHERLTHLWKARAESERLFSTIDQEMQENLRQFKKIELTVDMSAALAGLAMSLTGIVVKGMQAMKLSGKALEKANEELTKESAKFAVEPIRDVALEAAASRIDATKGVLWALGKSTIEAFLDTQSPSWWAGVRLSLRDGKSWSQAVTSNPEDSIVEARERVQNLRRETLLRLDSVNSRD